ncbi:MAG TPA: hypothetical protein VJ784_15590 [Pyrinomonadaceae bacterium]|nr:hypothetical protein [Pyrinomonadaceae bacterium]
MKTSASVLALVLVLGVAISCRLSERLGGGDKTVGTVSELWPDVPPFQGATKAEGEIPLAVRILMRTMMQGKVAFIIYRTDKSAQEVKDFYSPDRMKAAGWTPNDQGCTSNPEDKTNQGIFCFFSRKDSGKEEALSIIIARDDKQSSTNIIYGRVDTTQMKKK